MKKELFEQVQSALRESAEHRQTHAEAKQVQRAYDIDTATLWQKIYALDKERNAIIKALNDREPEGEVKAKLDYLNKRLIEGLDASFESESLYTKYFDEALAAKGTKTALEIIIEDTERKLKNDN